MHSYHFRHIVAPAPSTAHVIVVRNLKNAEEILSEVKKGAESFGDTPMTLIDARMITSSTHLLVAIHQALLRNARSFECSDDGERDNVPSSMRTKSVHSEILWNLSTTNNIAETFRVFGLTASTTNLILVHASVAAQDGGPTSDTIVRRVSTICQGDIDERGADLLDAWKGNSKKATQSIEPDWNAVTKAYRLNDLRPSVDDEDLSEAELQYSRKERIDAMATSLVSMKFVAS